MEMVFADELKKCIDSACIFDFVVYKLGYWQQFYLVILFEVDKSSTISLYYAILTFCLIVSLKVKYREKLLLDIEKKIE